MQDVRTNRYMNKKIKKIKNKNLKCQDIDILMIWAHRMSCTQAQIVLTLRGFIRAGFRHRNQDPFVRHHCASVDILTNILGDEIVAQ